MKPTILHADVLITMNADNAVIPDGGVLVGSDGRIQVVGEAPALIAANPGVPVKRLAPLRKCRCNERKKYGRQIYSA